MPPKVKITKKDIINAALSLVKGSGGDTVNARAIAKELRSSTQPIFSNFASMEELLGEVRAAAYESYLEFIRCEVESGKYPQYKAFGMAYIRFAKEEKELFKLLFMCDREKSKPTEAPDFDAAVEIIMTANGLSRERASLMHLEMWTAVHGIGTMLATSFLSLDFELISNILTDIYQGVRVRHIEEARENDGN